MKIGKKLGIVAIVLACLLVILGIVRVNQAPEFPDEFYELVTKDYEAATEMEEEILNNASGLFKFASSAGTVVALVGVVVAIISIVKMIKDKEPGKIIPILALILIIVTYVTVTFSVIDAGKAFEAGYNSAAQNQ